jgi:preprotein translocase subunit SecD
MATSPTTRKALKSLTWLLVLIAGLVGINAAGVIWGNGSWAPKLALDLEGGTQIVLSPKLESGQSVNEEQLAQAVAIIRQRIDASGVSEAEINTQGNNNIVVSLPGQPDDATLERIKSSAKLDFRAVLVAGAPTTTFVGEDGNSTPVPEVPVDPTLPSTPEVAPSDGSDLNWITPALQAEYEQYDCTGPEADLASTAPADEPLITCDFTGTIKYILGPVEVSGSDISDAAAGLQTTSTGATTGQWVISLDFNGQGTVDFSEVTTRLFGLTGSQNQFAIVLDGKVLSAPATNAAITNGSAEISGGFTQESAQTLANQLKYGALPIGFEVQSQDTISATLGTTQLVSGLLAGAIGLALVVVYSLLQYRALGLVTISSLIIVGIITYLLVTILSWREGYRLSLAGVAGLIVAIGITADSFIVYFERIRDEIRDGKMVMTAIEMGWKRALRTILASDTVNLLAALVLFFLAVGNVRGFAFTLGLTTLVDVIVVMLFTHPLMQLLSQTRFYNEGHKLSGLDPRGLGAAYRGRGQFVTAPRVSEGKRNKSSKEALKRQTIAERKAQMNAGEES